MSKAKLFIELDAVKKNKRKTKVTSASYEYTVKKKCT